MARLGIGLLLLLAACATRPEYPLEAEGAPVVEVHVIARGWHTDIGLPAGMPLQPQLAALAQDFPGVREMVFGFGDRSYLLERTPSPVNMLRALLPGPGAILLTALVAAPDVAFGAANVVPLRLSQAGFDRLQRFIAASLQTANLQSPFRGSSSPVPTGTTAPVVPLAEGPYPGSRFYPSNIVYAGTYTCNTWTAEALAAAGLPVGVSGVVFAHQVMHRARLAASSGQRGGPVAGQR